MNIQKNIPRIDHFRLSAETFRQIPPDRFLLFLIRLYDDEACRRDGGMIKRFSQIHRLFCAVLLTLPLLLRRFGQADLIVNIGLDQPAVLPPFLKDRRRQLRGKSLPFQYASGFRQPGPCAGITNHRHIAETEKPRFFPGRIKHPPRRHDDAQPLRRFRRHVLRIGRNRHVVAKQRPIQINGRQFQFHTNPAFENLFSHVHYIPRPRKIPIRKA